MNDTLVRNHPPRLDPGSVRLAVVGEAPGLEESSWRHCIPQGHGYAGRRWQRGQLVERQYCPLCSSKQWTESPEPFRGESGRLLDSLLSEAGLSRDRVWVGNVSRFSLSEADKKLEKCVGSLGILATELEDWKPNCVLVLGNLALHAFHPKREAVRITDWRGSIFPGSVDGHPRVHWKVVAAVHPAAVLREPQGLALLRRDVARAVEEAKTPELNLPERRIVSGTTDQIIGMLDGLRKAGGSVGYDIEGSPEGVTVMSFAYRPDEALSIPFRRLDFSRIWSPDEEAAIWAAAKALLEDPAVVKVCHQSAYEQFCLAWLGHARVSPVEDTMLAWASLYPELEKGLDVVASLLTRQPNWGRAGDWATEAERDLYNGIDSMVTLECWQAMQPLFHAEQRRYYEHQRALLAPILDMQLRGMTYDAEAGQALRVSLERQALAVQGELDAVAGIKKPTFEEVRDAVAYKIKRDRCVDWPDLVAYAKPSFREAL